MSRVLTFWVDGVPVPKGRPRTVRTKTGKVVTFTPKRTARWESVVRLVAQAACSAVRWKPTPGAYEVRIEVFPARRAGDADNFGKAIADAMNGIVYPDDGSVRRIDVTRQDVGVALGAMVRVTRLTEKTP
jgi:Holliday junction resolvase RusA-like endonuclease